MRKIHKIATFVLVGSMMVAGRAAIAQAAEEPIAGITVALDEFYQKAQDTDQETVQSLMDEISQYDNLAFAQVTSYVNIRDKASEEGEIVGKLYNNSAATIIKQEKDWYQIKSGSVTGYIKGEFLITGKKAEDLAKSIGKRIAVVNTTTLKVRKEPSEDAEVLTLVGLEDDLPVSKELDGWVKVEYDNNSYGYVSSDYVKVEMLYEEAVSIQEEQERLEEEEAANQNSDNSNNNSSSSGTNSGSSNQNSQTDTSSDSSSLGSSIASYAVQFQGNPYVWGGTSLTNGADCSGFTQSVFAHFGIYIPRTSRTQAASGRRVSLDSLRPGDLIFYARGGTINHVALYIGGGRVISASSPSTGIRITSYNYRQPVKAVRYTN